MKSKNYSTIAISSILAFVLITAAVTRIPTTSFENVLAQGENMTGMSQDQTYFSTTIGITPDASLLV